MNEKEINQNSYYPPELDENLHVKKSVNLKNRQKTPDFSAQNGQKNENFANLSDISAISQLLSGAENSDILSTIMALKNKKIPEALSAMGNVKSKQKEKVPPIPKIEEL